VQACRRRVEEHRDALHFKKNSSPSFLSIGLALAPLRATSSNGVSVPRKACKQEPPGGTSLAKAPKRHQRQLGRFNSKSCSCSRRTHCTAHQIRQPDLLCSSGASSSATRCSSGLAHTVPPGDTLRHTKRHTPSHHEAHTGTPGGPLRHTKRYTPAHQEAHSGTPRGTHRPTRRHTPANRRAHARVRSEFQGAAQAFRLEALASTRLARQEARQTSNHEACLTTSGTPRSMPRFVPRGAQASTKRRSPAHTLKQTRSHTAWCCPPPDCPPPPAAPTAAWRTAPDRMKSA